MLKRNPPTPKDQDPYQIIDDFFDKYDLAGSHQYVWELLVAAFSSADVDYWDKLDRSNAIFFCRNINELLKAADLIHEQQSNGL